MTETIKTNFTGARATLPDRPSPYATPLRMARPSSASGLPLGRAGFAIGGLTMTLQAWRRSGCPGRTFRNLAHRDLRNSLLGRGQAEQSGARFSCRNSDSLARL